MLQTEHFDFSLKNLVLLGSKLQFFACEKFFGGSERTASSLLDQFPNLEDFTCSCFSDWNYVNSINNTLRQLRGEESSAFTHPQESFTSASSSLAESLIELSVDCLSTVKFCPFTLPNLGYLVIDDLLGCPAINSTALASAPNLRCFTWQGRVDIQNLKYLMNFNQLIVLHVPIMFIEYNVHDKRTISLPTSLEKLNCNILFGSLEFVGHSSVSLEHLASRGTATFSLVCPNLKVLICDVIVLDQTSLPRLVHWCTGPTLSNWLKFPWTSGEFTSRSPWPPWWTCCPASLASLT